MKNLVAAFCEFLGSVSVAFGQSCGGNLGDFIVQMNREALENRHDASSVDQFFANVRQDSNVIRAV